MEQHPVGSTTFYATTEDALAPPPGAVRVRRLPLTSSGELAIDELTAAAADAPSAADGPSSAATAQTPLVLSRSHTAEPLALLLGRDEFGAAADASTTATKAAQGAPSLVHGPPLPSAAEGGPKEHATLCDALRDAAEHAPTSCGIRFVAGGTVTFESYAELLASARRMLHALRQLPGLEWGGVVALQVADTKLHLRAFWGCALGGIAPVAVAAPQKFAADNANVLKLLAALRVLQARHVLASTAGVAPLQALLPEGVVAHDAAALLASAPPEAPPEADADVQPGGVLFYQLTSGSTGTPKVIPELHKAVAAHIRQSCAQNGYLPTDVTLNWLPFDHVVPILTFHLADVYLWRTAVQLPTAEVVGEPLLWLRTMAEHAVTHSWAPNFGFKLVAQAASTAGSAHLAFDLSRLKSVMNAGEQVTAEVCDAFLACTGLPPSVMQPAFGMAECCTCMTYNNRYQPAGSAVAVLKVSLQEPVLRLAPVGSTTSECAQFMDLGPPSPGVEIRIATAEGQVLGELQVGRLQIKGACVMQGYHQNPKANAECMLADGWFDSGDLGFVHEGRLALTGRAKEMIIIRGANFYCYEIEDLVTTVDGTLPARVAATSVHDEQQGTEALLLFFVPDPAAHAAAGLALLHQQGARCAATPGPRPHAPIPTHLRPLACRRAARPAAAAGRGSQGARRVGPRARRALLLARGRRAVPPHHLR